jgi:hypothetical protein
VWEPTTAERAYNEGRSTQVPVNPVVCVKGRVRAICAARIRSWCLSDNSRPRHEGLFAAHDIHPLALQDRLKPLALTDIEKRQRRTGRLFRAALELGNVAQPDPNWSK